MPELNARRLNQILLLLILLLSAWVKLYAAQLLAWEADYVPLIAHGQAWLDGGVFPAVGTLSSVAAYNMPFLVWMQIPALLFTRDVQIVLIATQLAFNLLGTWLMYRLGSRLFNPGAGLIAAALFTFSETGISSAYTAWAQLQLPIFTVAFAFCLYLWKTEGRPWQIASTWIIATAAFMTHFSAVLLYGVLLIMWLLLRLSSNIRGLTVGLLVSAAMLAPYMTVQTRNDFVDLRAFFQPAQPYQPGGPGRIRPFENGSASCRPAGADTGSSGDCTSAANSASAGFAFQPWHPLAREHSAAIDPERPPGVPRRVGKLARASAAALRPEQFAACHVGSLLLVGHCPRALKLFSPLAGQLPLAAAGATQFPARLANGP